MEPVGDGARRAFALVRLDDHGEWTLREPPGLISVLKVLPTREEAEAEANALNETQRAAQTGAQHCVVFTTFVY
jgi:hypothetical protein